MYISALMKETDISENLVKQAFDKATEKSHIIVCWVGIVLNLVWFLGDYLSIPEYWIPFLNFRIAVSVVSILLLVFRTQLKQSIYTCIFLLVLGISVQNAYMWSVMDIPHLQKHAFAYMVLFIGVGMLVLWELKLSIILVAITIISNVFFYALNSKLTIEEFITNGALLVLTVVIFSVFLIRNRYQLTYKELKSRLELEKSKELIESQKVEVEEKNEEVKSSIRYAKRIQDALLPSDESLNKLFDNNYFVYYNPKDIVSGDFYWASPVRTSGENPMHMSLTAVVDCTGHGVPGAFISLVASSFLKQSLTEPSVNNTAEALDYLNHCVINTLNQTSTSNEARLRDGMDIALVAINYKSNTLYYSGANNPIYIYRTLENKTTPELHVLNPDKQAIGSSSDFVKKYTLQQFDLHAGDNIYLFTDGYADQFGGSKNKKLTYKKFKEILGLASQLPIELQRDYLQKTYIDWRGANEQIDDVCVMGIKI